jgi:SAM-dependent methyltransferase
VRSAASLRRHYEIERELADRLRNAPRAERRVLYSQVYNELFTRVHDHPQNVRKKDPARQADLTRRQLAMLGRFLTPETVYVEIGAGDCHLAMEVAQRVKHAYAVDVSDLIAGGEGRPERFTLLISDGVGINLPDGAATVAYSNQLMEHLHPDDARDQLGEIARVLAPGGRYVCVTPHRYSGPQDVSAGFDDEATGFHLKEYTYAEIRRLFREAGLGSTTMWVAVKGHFVRVPELGMLAAEWVLGMVPRRARKWIADGVLRSAFSQVRIVGRKTK